MKGALDLGGCFPTGRHYPGIAHLIRVVVQGLASEFESERPVRGIPWVAIDTETTGRDAENDRVVEIGCVAFVDGAVVDRKSWLINPGRPIPADATAVHGISDDDVRDQPAIAEVFPEVLEFVAARLPLAYNADFDRRFLLAELGRSGMPAELPPAFRPDVVWLDPLSWARELQKEEKSRALGDVTARLGIALERAHRATDDAEAAGQVLVHFLSDPRVPSTYGAFLREQLRLERLFEFERGRWRS
ncbi:MAG TPA: 3'-5' exonuclease [Polyangiaceae bacterium]|nr:3'-5' exonuclease [Polyangiaceae bacterium]